MDPDKFYNADPELPDDEEDLDDIRDLQHDEMMEDDY
jgi:hypothetical protein